MLKEILKPFRPFIACTLLSLALWGCEENQDATPSYEVDVQWGSYSTAEKVMDAILPKAHAQVSSLNMCFKRLRFKRFHEDTLTPETHEDNVDFALGDIDINQAGTQLGTITLPQGDYVRVEFDVEPDCAYGSLRVDNDNDGGTPFTTSERITIKFDGNFSANDHGVLILGVQQILNALNSYDGSVDLKTAAEAVSGQLSN